MEHWQALALKKQSVLGKFISPEEKHASVSEEKNQTVVNKENI